ncbi:DUF4189 domain-containing protein [Burkholderia cepacia]|uniref:DUF4189 domain-containing protein n=1 Tax=Burkholderia cepacia TaxID=292 RepID=UPI003C7D2AF4
MRRITWSRSTLALSLLSACLLVHAEGNCPRGYYPLGDPGQGSSGCAPRPDAGGQETQSSSSSPISPKWVTTWGAIALYIPKGILGSATHLGSVDEAEHAALRDCKLKGGLDCKLAISFGNQCAAMVAGNPGYNVTLGVTPADAERNGMTECRGAGNAGCHVYYLTCSLPQQVQ